jgi:hypothetical protein
VPTPAQPTPVQPTPGRPTAAPTPGTTSQPTPAAVRPNATKQQYCPDRLVNVPGYCVNQSASLPFAECSAWQDFYSETKGLGWSGCNASKYNPCSCADQNCKVTCTAGSITTIKLSGGGLQGSLPVTLGSLTALRYLFVDKNELGGEIPSSIGQLTALQYLLLNENKLTGHIPGDALGRLKKLRKLWLHKNSFSGHCPAGLNGTISNCDMSHNPFTCWPDEQKTTCAWCTGTGGGGPPTCSGSNVHSKIMQHGNDAELPATIVQ